MRNGAEYLEALNDGRKVIVAGREIPNLGTDPVTRDYARLVASFYDLHHKPDLRDKLTFVDEDGKTRSLTWLHPRSLADLRRRRAYHDTIARAFTAGFWGRLPDANNCMFISYIDDPDPWAEHSIDLKGRPLTGRVSSKNIVKLWNFFRDNDLNVSPSFINPQVDRSGPQGEETSETALKTVAITDSGIVVSGWKPTGTATAFADWLHVGVFWRPGVPGEQVQYFAVPMNTPGVTIFSRAPVNVLKAHAADHPIASLGDELDCMIHFNNVMVPWENVFHVGSPNHAMLYPDRIFDPLQYHIVVRQAVKAELIAGLAILVSHSTGTLKIPGVATRVAKLCEFREIMRAWLYSSEELGFSTPNGTFKPNPLIYDAGRGYYMETAPGIIHELLDLSGRHVTFLPSEPEWQSPAWKREFEALLGTQVMSGESRLKIFRVLRDLFLSDWGQRQLMFENFNGTPVHTRRMLTMARAHEYGAEGPLATLARDVCGITASELKIGGGLADENIPKYARSQDADATRPGTAEKPNNQNGRSPEPIEIRDGARTPAANAQVANGPR